MAIIHNQIVISAKKHTAVSAKILQMYRYMKLPLSRNSAEKP